MAVSAVADPPELHSGNICMYWPHGFYCVFVAVAQSAVCSSNWTIYGHLPSPVLPKLLFISCLISLRSSLSCSLINDFFKLPYSSLHPPWLLHLAFFPSCPPAVLLSLYFFSPVVTSLLGHIFRHLFFFFFSFLAVTCYLSCYELLSFLILSLLPVVLLKCCFTLAALFMYGSGSFIYRASCFLVCPVKGMEDVA